MIGENGDVPVGGRGEVAVVRAYLDGLEAHRRYRGRARTADRLRKRLWAIAEEWEHADSLARLHLVQERMDLAAELERMEVGSLADLELAFVRIARSYSERRAPPSHEGVMGRG